MSTLPTNPSEAFKRRNPHLYKGSISNVDAPRNVLEPQKVSEQPKSPEDRLNKTEREFLEWLRKEFADGVVGIQSVTLQIGFDCRYTPDFWVHYLDTTWFYEVKGFMRDDARVKLFAAARAFPFWRFVLVKKTKEGWDHKLIPQ